MKQKIILTTLFLTILSLSIFVSASMSRQGNGPYDIEIELNKGWNVIAGTMPEDGISADSEIQASNIKAMWYYHPQSNEYIRVHPNPELSKLQQADDDVVLTSAMWVYSDKAGIIKYSTLEDYMPLENRQLVLGFNFFTITSDIEGLTFEDIEGSCNIEKVFGWDSSVQNWVVFPLDEDFHRDILGLGLIVKVSSNCNFDKFSSGSGDVISPPPIIPSCQDSDGGLNYDVQGEVSDGVENLEDFCVSDTKLSEALCNNDGNAAYAQYNCPNGCNNGACN